MSISLTQICNAIEQTLSAATGLAYTAAPSEIGEGIQDWPILQVYPESGETDGSQRSDRSTFRAGSRITVITVNADLYARPRQHLGEDLAELLPLIDAITDVLEGQDTKPYFGLEGIKAFHWSWQRVTFVFGDPQVRYVGARFVLRLWVY